MNHISILKDQTDQKHNSFKYIQQEIGNAIFSFTHKQLKTSYKLYVQTEQQADGGGGGVDDEVYEVWQDVYLYVCGVDKQGFQY